MKLTPFKAVAFGMLIGAGCVAILGAGSLNKYVGQFYGDGFNLSNVVASSGAVQAITNPAGYVGADGTFALTNGNGYVQSKSGGLLYAYEIRAGEPGSDTAPGAGIIRGFFIGSGANVTNIPLANISESGASTNQVPQWNGSAWVPENVVDVISNTSLVTISNLSVSIISNVTDIQVNTNVTFNQNITVKGTAKVSGNLFVQSLTSTNGLTNLNGNIKINGAAYAWPNANSGGALQNDGLGNLNWTPVATLGGANVYTGSQTGDGSGWTNLTYRYTTNPIPALKLSWGKAYFTNIAANISITLDTPGNNSFETIALWVTNGSATDFSITGPNGVWGTPGSGTPPVYYCTNKVMTRLMIEHYGQIGTNMYKLDFAP